MIRFLLPLLFLSILLSAEEPPPGEMRLQAALEAQPNGDLTGNLRFDLAPKNYAAVRGQRRSAVSALREFRPDGASFECASDCAFRYDDAVTAITVDLHALGVARSVAPGRWEIGVSREADLVTSKEEKGRTSFHFYEVGQTRIGLAYRGPISFQLPPGATESTWDAERRTVGWSMPTVPPGEARLESQVSVREGLMPGLYKLYGMPDLFPDLWVAHVVLRNAGEGAARDLRVRMRLPGYADWSDVASDAEFVPGQTAVVSYHPLLDRSITTLRATTPIDLAIEWSWKGADGAPHEGRETQRATFLGGREFVFSSLRPEEVTGTFQETFSNVPLLAAWVTRDDPVVQQFAAMANKNAAGVGAAYDDGDALKAIQACYELMLLNDFTYQSPRGLDDPSLSFDSKLVQNLKYPRDVIRDKSGTCIELAILFAAMAHDIGLTPYLVVKSGHCFPVIKLPIGKGLVAVEATGIKGGVRFGADPFEKVLFEGKKELEEVQKSGEFVMVDVEQAWMEGVACPELDVLPGDIMKQWGISEKGVAGGLMPRGDGEGSTGDKAGFAGKWVGDLPQVLEDGKQHPSPAEVLIQADGEGRYRMFATMQATGGAGKVQQEFVAEEQEGQLVFQGTHKTALDAASGESKDLEPDRGVLKVDGGNLVGKFGSDQLGFVDVKLTRK